MTVLIYLDTSTQVGDPDHFKVFASADAAEAWFAENDPEGVAFEYPVIADQPAEIEGLEEPIGQPCLKSRYPQTGLAKSWISLAPRY